MIEPPPNPLADDPPLVTRAELDRLATLRRHRTWYDLATASDAASFLLGLVDRLLGRALLPGEDVYPPENPADQLTVTSGPSLYMCGHGDWHVHVRGRPGIVLSFTAGPLDVARLRDLLGGRYPPATGDAAR